MNFKLVNKLIVGDSASTRVRQEVEQQTECMVDLLSLYGQGFESHQGLVLCDALKINKISE